MIIIDIMAIDMNNTDTKITFLERIARIQNEIRDIRETPIANSCVLFQVFLLITMNPNQIPMNILGPINLAKMKKIISIIHTRERIVIRSMFTHLVDLRYKHLSYSKDRSPY